MPTDIQNVEEILRKLVSFDTVSRNSNRALIEWVRDYLRNHGVNSEIIVNDDGSKACLWATVGDAAGGIVLAGHSDVVPVAGQDWTSDPFMLTERDDKLYGRGTCDMKGFIACALAFVPEFLAAKTGGGFHIALTSDEETDMSGAERLADFLIRHNISPAWVWIGEPTGLQIVNQHKGVAYYRTSITGVSGHSGQPDRGLSAIELADDFMQIVRAFADEKADRPFSPSRFDPPYTSFNLATITGGSAENIIAGHCELTWQVRAHPGDSAAACYAEIDKRATEIFAPRFKKFPAAGMSGCTCFDIPAFTATPGNPGEKTLKRHLRCDETQAVSFATEAGIYQKSGAPAVVCGPGSIDQAHQPDEFVDKSQLSACVDLMRAVLLSSVAP